MVKFSTTLTHFLQPRAGSVLYLNAASSADTDQRGRKYRQRPLFPGKSHLDPNPVNDLWGSHTQTHSITCSTVLLCIDVGKLEWGCLVMLCYRKLVMGAEGHGVRGRIQQASRNEGVPGKNAENFLPPMF